VWGAIPRLVLFCGPRSGGVWARGVGGGDWRVRFWLVRICLKVVGVFFLGVAAGLYLRVCLGCGEYFFFLC